MPGNPLVRFDEGRVGRTARCRPLSYSTVRIASFLTFCRRTNVGQTLSSVNKAIPGFFLSLRTVQPQSEPRPRVRSCCAQELDASRVIPVTAPKCRHKDRRVEKLPHRKSKHRKVRPDKPKRRAPS